MLLLMLLMKWAEGLLLPGTSIIMPHCNPKCQRTQTCRGKRQQASRAHACFNSCFALGNIRHSTRRMVGSCGTTHLAFFVQSLSSTSLTAISPETDLTCHSQGSGLISKCFICLSLDIQIAHDSLFSISIFFLLPKDGLR